MRAYLAAALAPFLWLLTGVSWLLRPVFSDLQRTLSLGYLKQRGVRAALVVLSIALGVGVLVATRTLNQNLGRVAQSAFNPLAGSADLIVWNAQTGVPLSLEERLRRPGVKGVEPVVVGRALLPDLGNRPVMLFGVRLPGPGQDLDRALPAGLKVTVTPLEGVGVLDLLTARPKAVVGKDVAAALAGARPGDRGLRVRLAGAERNALAVASVEVDKGGPLLDNSVFMDVKTAAGLVYPRRPGFVSHFHLHLEPGVAPEEVARDLRQELGPPYQVQTLSANNDAVGEVFAGLELGFALGGAGALVVGLFLVYNALSVSVAERRHDIGILRAVGATRGQIAMLFVTEAAILGLVGSGLGIPLGYALARVAAGPISRVLSDTFTPVDLAVNFPNLALVLLALAGGVGTTILASLAPAVQAAREEPANAVRRVPQTAVWLGRFLQLGGAALLLGAGALCVVFRESLPTRFGPFAGIVCILIGLLVVTPLLSEIVGRALQPLFRHFLGLEGRLAADNLARSPSRTGLVIAALAATTGLLVQTAGFIESTEHGVLEWVDEFIAADLFVTAGSPITEPATAMPADEAVADRLRALPEVDAVLPVRLHFGLPFRDRLVVLLALDADAFHRMEGREMPLARNLERFPRLKEPGTALVSENFAALYRVGVGDTVTIDGPEGPLPLEVIGTVVDYTWNRGTILVNRAWYREQFRDTQVDIFDVYLKPGVDRAAARQTITDALGADEAIHAVTRDELRETISRQLRQVYSLAYAQQAVVGMVALLGVISAVFISVLQRRRQLGLLRAVGASQGHVLRSVLAEALLMGVIGSLLGFGIGVLLEWYLIDFLIFDESGFVFPLRIAWFASGVVMALAVALATLVGLWPAWHATRVRIAEAIAYE